jgi:hypothetical protein
MKLYEKFLKEVILSGAFLEDYIPLRINQAPDEVRVLQLLSVLKKIHFPATRGNLRLQ